MLWVTRLRDTSRADGHTSFPPSNSKVPAMKHNVLSMLIVAASLWFTAPLWAETAVLQVTVDAGQHDRTNVPVCTLITLPKALAKSTVVIHTGVDGKSIVGQLTAPSLLAPSLLAKTTKPADGNVQRELHFIWSGTKGTKATLTFEVVGGIKAASGGFAWYDTKGDYTHKSLTPQTGNQGSQVGSDIANERGFVTRAKQDLNHNP